MNCFYCDSLMTEVHGDPLQRTKDHRVPISRGGSGLASNKVKCCASCNNDKGRLTVDEYRLVIAYRRGIPLDQMVFPGEKADPEAQYRNIMARLDKLKIEEANLTRELDACICEIGTPSPSFEPPQEQK